MNYNSKRLTNPLKPICRCKRQEFNTLVDIVCGSTSTKEHNKNFAFKKAMDELTSPCIDKDKESLTLAELVKKIPYPIANVDVSIACDVFDRSNDGVKPSGFLILIGEDNIVKCAESIYFNGDRYWKNSSIDEAQKENIYDLRFPLTDKDVIFIKEALKFEGNPADYTSVPLFNNSYTGTIYIYKLNDTD